MLNDNIQALFLQAFTWGGGTTDQQGREKFNKFLRDKIAETKFEGPARGPGHLRILLQPRGQVEGWMAQEGKPTSSAIHRIVVPTVDSVRHCAAVHARRQQVQRAFTGDTGTGKTVNVNSPERSAHAGKPFTSQHHLPTPPRPIRSTTFSRKNSRSAARASTRRPWQALHHLCGRQHADARGVLCAAAD